MTDFAMMLLMALMTTLHFAFVLRVSFPSRIGAVSRKMRTIFILTNAAIMFLMIFLTAIYSTSLLREGIFGNKII